MVNVTAIVPNWNRCDLLGRVLRCLGQQTHPLLEIVVVDNGSDDDSVNVAKQLGARVVQMGFNAGFSRAVNRGIQESRGEWVAIVNNDVELQPDWLERLMESVSRSGAWFATGKIYQAGSGRVLDGAFDAVARSGCAWRCGQGRADDPVWSEETSIWFAPFTAAVFRRELFEQLGGLDESFESYLEDVDFGLRCALASREGSYVPAAVGWHRGSATLGRWHPETVRLISRNQLLLVAKHYSRRWLVRFLWPLLVGQLLWGLVALRHGAGWAWCKGKLEGLAQFAKQRRRAQASDGVGAVLRRSERQIRRLQQLTGFDRYWRLYFALT